MADPSDTPAELPVPESAPEGTTRDAAVLDAPHEDRAVIALTQREIARRMARLRAMGLDVRLRINERGEFIAPGKVPAAVRGLLRDFLHQAGIGIVAEIALDSNDEKNRLAAVDFFARYGLGTTSSTQDGQGNERAISGIVLMPPLDAPEVSQDAPQAVMGQLDAGTPALPTTSPGSPSQHGHRVTGRFGDPTPGNTEGYTSSTPDVPVIPVTNLPAGSTVTGTLEHKAVSPEVSALRARILEKKSSQA